MWCPERKKTVNFMLKGPATIADSTRPFQAGCRTDRANAGRYFRRYEIECVLSLLISEKMLTSLGKRRNSKWQDEVIKMCAIGFLTVFIKLVEKRSPITTRLTATS